VKSVCDAMPQAAGCGAMPQDGDGVRDSSEISRGRRKELRVVAVEGRRRLDTPSGIAVGVAPSS
jgi:hypothetical protein